MTARTPAAPGAACPPAGPNPDDEDDAGRERILAQHRDDIRRVRRLLDRAMRADPGDARVTRSKMKMQRAIEAMERNLAAATALHAATVARRRANRR
jgi:hypothetical protein